MKQKIILTGILCLIHLKNIFNFSSLLWPIIPLANWRVLFLQHAHKIYTSGHAREIAEKCLAFWFWLSLYKAIKTVFQKCCTMLMCRSHRESQDLITHLLATMIAYPNYLLISEQNKIHLCNSQVLSRNFEIHSHFLLAFNF